MRRHGRGKPKLDEGHRGLQYGGQNHHKPPPAPKPTQLPPAIRAVPFGENKTSDQIEKRKELQREAEEDILRFKAEQAKRKDREMAEKKKDFEQLKHHFMLDGHKYGHGAPKASGDYRRTKFSEEEKVQQSPRYRDPSYGNPDRVLTKPLDYDYPEYQQEGRKSIENRYRYNRPQHEKDEYRRDLERQQEERELKEKAGRIERLRQELDMLKSGQQTQSGGGAPNWSLSEQQTWKPQPPAGAAEPKSLELERSQGGAGAPIMDSDGKAVTRHPITMKRNDQGESSIREKVGRRQLWEPENDAYMAFGRPGAGAPIKDSDGNIVTAVYGKLGGELSSADRRRRTRAARLLRDDLQKEMVEQKKNKEDFDNHMKAPVGDLSTLMLEGKVGRPMRDPVTGTLRNQHLIHSDISRQKQNRSETMDKGGTKDYHDYLTRQAEERDRTKRLNKLREDQEWRQHNDAFDSMFGGKFGGGNRKGDNLKKESLANTLFSPRRDENPQVQSDRKEVSDASQEKPYQSEPNEDYSASDIGQRYIKNTVKSSYKNMYELPSNGPTSPYAYRTPYALLGNN